ncbi:choice-of-anchor K domain-containing protein [Dapis sp. BLCC M126]|uniref:choice-of-anchor K domain-containing protein n=1 Tax=Dapis sp. BLCC M126 TaxID=3400189 RepID=UPI003CE7022E
MNRTKFLPTLIATTTMLLATTGKVEAITFAGTSSGSWGLPVVSAGAEYLSDENGGTNNRLTWGHSVAGSFTNYVQYDGLGFSTGVNTLFAVGDLTYRNGATFNTFNGDFPLEVKLSFTNPFNSIENFNYTFNILNTPNYTGNPVLDGDKLQFQANGLTSDSFNFDGVNYTVKLIGFSSDGGNTFLSEFNSPEQSTAEAMLYAEIIRADVVDVPEPTAIFGLGLLGVYLAGSLKTKP